LEDIAKEVASVKYELEEIKEVMQKSVDGGVTWSTVFPTTAAIFNIAIDPGISDILYAGTIGHGAFKSTNGGQNWSSIVPL
jgi:hypothetical protein